MFAKFYAQSERQNFFITHQLPLLLEEVRPHVRRWFFMRYRDPQPHLRVRFHGDAEALRNHVLTALERHTRRLQMSGAISSMQLASYEPEEHRYGGRAAMSWAEEIFHQDSTSALIQLRGRAHSGINMADELWAALNYAALLDSLGSWDWASWVHHAFQKEAEHEYYKKHRAEAERLIVPGRAAERLAEIFSAPTLKTLWQPSEASQNYAVAIGIDKAHPANEGTITSLLHMQHNRLIGINPEKEKRSYAILRGAVSAYWHKRRRGLV
ncbi:thiopeptide-type bacteriocin biosynthesis protein [Streptomyces indonesiensis]